MEAELSILYQPVSKFRFRHSSENGTHGSLKAEGNNEEFPQVELKNYSGKAVIRCSLYQDRSDLPHPHSLVCRSKNEDVRDPHYFEMDSSSKETILTLKGMGIISTKKENIVQILNSKMSEMLKHDLNKTLYTSNQATEVSNTVDMHKVRICFEALREEPNGSYKAICPPVFSTVISNSKSSTNGNLRICRLSTPISSVLGKDELILLVDKVDKNNIKVRFFEEDSSGNLKWEEFGIFSKHDVHYQYAIFLLTPPYKDLEVESVVDVKIQLVRENKFGREQSTPLPFKYKPDYGINSRKRKRYFYETTESVPQSSQTNEDLLKCLSEVDIGTLEQICHSVELDDFVPFSDNLDLIFEDGQGLEHDGLFSLEGREVCQGPCEPQADFGNLNRRNNLSLREKLTKTNLINHLISSNSFKDEKKLINVLNSMNINFTHLRGIENPLFVACIQNRPCFIPYLLLNKCDPNEIDLENGNTILHLVANENFLECAKHIIGHSRRGILLNINSINYDGYTCLHNAIRCGHLQMVKYLIEEGSASVLITELKSGNSSLMLAVESGYLDIVKYLLRLPEIDLEIKNFGGNSVLDIAKTFGDSKIIDIIIKCFKMKNIPFEIDTDSDNTDIFYLKSSEENNLQKSNICLEVNSLKMFIVGFCFVLFGFIIAKFC